MQNRFNNKTIQLAITLSKGTFDDKSNTKIIEGLACEVAIEKPGLPDKNGAEVKIWGLKSEDMGALTMLSFRPTESQHNLISIKAGEGGKAPTLIFQGEIIRASADFNELPDPCMQLEAESGSYPQQISLPMLTVKGEAEAEGLFRQFAEAAGYSFINQGVSAKVLNGCYPGSPVDKMLKLAKDIGCELFIDDGVVLTLPAGRARAGGVTTLSKDSGLIGYPTFTQDGISCKSLFNPKLSYGGLINVQSAVPGATGLWKITKLSHRLSAWLPSGGSWESQVEAAYNG